MSLLDIETTDVPPDATDEERARALVETISAYIETYHGGAIDMVSFDGETLRIKLLGACAGCSLSPGTVHGLVEGNFRLFFPLLKTVEVA